MNWKSCLLALGWVGTLSAQSDYDADGLPDVWEDQFGSDKDTPNADADFDRDHVSSAEEHAAGTNPTGVWKATEILQPSGVSWVIPKLNINGEVMMNYHQGGWKVAVWDPQAPANLQDIPGGFYGYDWNDSGEIVGVVFGGSSAGGRHYKPWSGTEIYDLSADLGPGMSRPYQISNMGEIIGYHTGHGPFYENFLGFVDSYKDDWAADSLDYAESYHFSGINDLGSAVGTYRLNMGAPEDYIFMYQQSDPTLPGYFFETLIPSQLPETNFDFEYLSPAFINDHGEIAGSFSASNQYNWGDGIFYFDGNITWNLVDTLWQYPSVRGLSNWPHLIYETLDGNWEVDESIAFHDHVRRQPEDLTVTNPSGGTMFFQAGAAFHTLSDNGHFVVRGKLPGDSSDKYYLLELDQDSDSDGLPDDWETVNNVSSPTGNPDGDQFSNYEEFLNNTDPQVAETLADLLAANSTSSSAGIDDDGDGIPNSVEGFWGLNRSDSSDAGEDSDGDGLSNLQEFLAGTSAISIDTDRDGFTDSEELENGTDPTVANTSLQPSASTLAILTPHQ